MTEAQALKLAVAARRQLQDLVRTLSLLYDGGYIVSYSTTSNSPPALVSFEVTKKLQLPETNSNAHAKVQETL